MSVRSDSRLTVTLPPDLYEQVKELADLYDRSLNGQIVHMVRLLTEARLAFADFGEEESYRRTAIVEEIIRSISRKSPRPKALAPASG